ncbi:MAG: hypothetical protein LCH37_14905 [Bacteroidetes bacterium]|jgi:hypothetical protein|nr:hypothetical protein [Bacteroidota bacterium]
MSKPNYTGTQLEKFIEDRLIERKYQFVSKEKFKPAIYLGQPIYCKQFPLNPSIYETQLFGDFVLFHPEKWPQCLIIESKWQQSGGSVDEKFPFLVRNIQERHPYQTIVLLDGGGYKKKAEEWMRNQVGNNLLHVFNMGEFQKWVNQGNI